MQVKYWFVFGFVFVAHFGFSQIEINQETTKKEKKEQEKSVVDGSSVVFFTANWSHTNRKLIENDGFFGDSLGMRADEEGIGSWSYNLGVRTRIKNYLEWEGGLSFMTNGEKLKVSNEDTSFNYTTRYSFISMPIKLYYSYGEDIRFFAGAGVVPQMFMRTKQSISYLNEAGESVKEENVYKSGYTSFAFSVVFNLGVEISMGERLGLLILPEYKHQLTSTYVKNDSYKHYGRSLGVSFGLTMKL